VTQETRIKSFRDLRVWQVGMKLVEQVYVLTQAFPKHELYGLASQMQRAAVSIPSNIAEGHTREHLKEYLQHLSIARSSLAELETQLEIATRLDYCRSEQIKPLLEQMDALGKQLSALRNALPKGFPPST
jgi:four helix bundle protein